MSRQLPSLLPLACLAAASSCFCAGAANGRGSVAAPVTWDSAFQDRSGTTPLHFVAQYLDGHGASHRLEEWRMGEQHLRRKTDERIDLHADAAGKPLPGQPVDYTWQILDLQRHIAHRVSTAGMLHLGMLYSYYSMGHVLSRPAGTFALQPSSAPAEGASSTPAMARLRLTCQWWQIAAVGQPSVRVCWLPQHGIPAELWSQSPAGWRQTFSLTSLETHSIAKRTFLVETAGFQVRDVDELESDD